MKKVLVSLVFLIVAIAITAAPVLAGISEKGRI
jgi:hypothetical protein